MLPMFLLRLGEVIYFTISNTVFQYIKLFYPKILHLKMSFSVPFLNLVSIDYGLTLSQIYLPIMPSDTEITSIPSKPWFHNLNLSRKLICSFSRLRFGHSLLPSHSFKLSLNDSPFCIFPHIPAVCDFNHILFNLPFLSAEHSRFFSLLHSHNNTPDARHIFSSQSVTAVTATISFFLNTGLLI